MSARHVWDVYNTKSVYVDKVNTSSGSSYTKYTNYTYWGAVGTGYTFDPQTGAYSLSGYDWRSDSTSINAQAYPYLMIKISNTAASTPAGTVLLHNRYQYQYDEPLYWTFFYRTVSGTASFYDIVLVRQSDLSKLNSSNFTSYSQRFDYRYSESTTAQGDTKTGTVSNSSSSAYPSNGLGTTTATKSNWYLYKGSDSIDPVSVTYNKTELNAGDSITIKVSPAAPTYGGTVYYLYQYSINGGTSWSNINSRTASTTASITIPEGAAQFQARVLASDDWGFTSTTYVTGPSLSVSQLKAYVGVNGKARAVQKIYVGVNGKAREVIRGYIGVNGKARRFL